MSEFQKMPPSMEITAGAEKKQHKNSAMDGKTNGTRNGLLKEQ